MNEKDRAEINKVKKTLKESQIIADKDADKTTSPEDNAYYRGLSDAYNNAYEAIRKMK